MSIVHVLADRLPGVRLGEATTTFLDTISVPNTRRGYAAALNRLVLDLGADTEVGALFGALFGAAYGASAAPLALADIIHRFHGRLRCPHPVTLALHATDTDDHWWVRIGPGRPLSGLGRSDGADTEVHARAAELFLLLWNRRTSGGLDVCGEPAGLQIWQRDARR